MRIGGCERGVNCIYSHDLEHSAGLPVDDPDALRETLEYFVRLRKDQRRQVDVRGSVVKAWGGGPPCLTMRGKCGDTLLHELGGSRPGDGAPPVPDSDAVLVWRLADEQAPGSQPFPHADRSRLQQERKLLQQAINRSPGVKKTNRKTGAAKGKAKAELLGKPHQQRAAAHDIPPPPPPPLRAYSPVRTSWTNVVTPCTDIKHFRATPPMRKTRGRQSSRSARRTSAGPPTSTMILQAKASSPGSAKTLRWRFLRYSRHCQSAS